MKTADECLDMLAAAYRCLDVAMTETIEVIQLDAYQAGMKHACRIIQDHKLRTSAAQTRLQSLNAVFDEIALKHNELRPKDMK